MRPLISVVIPSFNHARYIEQAIESVLTQTYPNIELIVVDDGSTDESRDVIRSTLKSAPSGRSKFVPQENSGAHAAIMRGISESTGRFIAILNSDDFFYPERLQVMSEAIGHETLALAISQVDIVDADGHALPEDSAWPRWYRGALSSIDTTPTLGFALLDQNFAVSSGNFLFTRALYDKLSGFSTHKFVHDWDFLIRSIYCAEPLFVPTPLMAYRIHPQNTTESVRSLLETEEREAVARYLELFNASRSLNPLAPHPTNWPGFYPLFLSRKNNSLGRHVAQITL